MVDMHCLKRACKQRTGAVKCFIEGFGIAVEDGLDECINLDIAFLTNQEMIVIGHQTVSDDTDGRYGKTFFDTAKQEDIVLFIVEYQFAVGSPIVDMEVLARNKNDSSSCHRFISKVTQVRRTSEVRRTLSQ